jgi:hypothetical protein
MLRRVTQSSLVPLSAEMLQKNIHLKELVANEALLYKGSGASPKARGHHSSNHCGASTSKTRLKIKTHPGQLNQTRFTLRELMTSTMLLQINHNTLESLISARLLWRHCFVLVHSDLIRDVNESALWTAGNNAFFYARYEVDRLFSCSAPHQ